MTDVYSLQDAPKEDDSQSTTSINTVNNETPKYTIKDSVFRHLFLDPNHHPGDHQRYPQRSGHVHKRQIPDPDRGTDHLECEHPGPHVHLSGGDLKEPYRAERTGRLCVQSHRTAHAGVLRGLHGQPQDQTGLSETVERSLPRKVRRY